MVGVTVIKLLADDFFMGRLSENGVQTFRALWFAARYPQAQAYFCYIFPSSFRPVKGAISDIEGETTER